MAHHSLDLLGSGDPSTLASQVLIAWTTGVHHVLAPPKGSEASLEPATALPSETKALAGTGAPGGTASLCQEAGRPLEGKSDVGDRAGFAGTKSPPELGPAVGLENRDSRAGGSPGARHQFANRLASPETKRPFNKGLEGGFGGQNSSRAPTERSHSGARETSASEGAESSLGVWPGREALGNECLLVRQPPSGVVCEGPQATGSGGGPVAGGPEGTEALGEKPPVWEMASRGDPAKGPAWGVMRPRAQVIPPKVDLGRPQAEEAEERRNAEPQMGLVLEPPQGPFAQPPGEEKESERLEPGVEPPDDIRPVYSGKFFDRTPGWPSAGKVIPIGYRVATCLTEKLPRLMTPPEAKKYFNFRYPPAGAERVFYGRANDPQVAPYLTHGIRSKVSIPAGTLINPQPITTFQQKVKDQKESIYLSNQRAPLGRSHDQTPGLPEGMDIINTTFGTAVIKEFSARDVVNPPKSHEEVFKEGTAGHDLYVVSHNDYYVGECPLIQVGPRTELCARGPVGAASLSQAAAVVLPTQRLRVDTSRGHVPTPAEARAALASARRGSGPPGLVRTALRVRITPWLTPEGRWRSCGPGPPLRLCRQGTPLLPPSGGRRGGQGRPGACAPSRPLRRVWRFSRRGSRRHEPAQLETSVLIDFGLSSTVEKLFVLMWKRGAQIVSKRVDDFKEKFQHKLGRVLDPIADTMNVPPDHTFGACLRPEAYGVGDLIHSRLPGEYLRGSDRQRAQLAAVRHRLKTVIHQHFDTLLAAFRHYDKKGDGVIDRAELREACDQAGLHLDRTLLDQLFHYCDMDGDGLISYLEFANFLTWKDRMPLKEHEESVLIQGGKQHCANPAEASVEESGPALLIKPEDLVLKEPGSSEKTLRTLVRPGDKVSNYYKTTSSEISSVVGAVPSLCHPICGVPTIRSDIPAPRIRRISDRTNYGEDGTAHSLLCPTIFAQRGVFERDFFKARSKEEIADILCHIGVKLSEEEFEHAWRLASKKHHRGEVCVENIRNVLDELRHAERIQCKTPV
ncbi:EF-hand domain-containing family member B [Carlito syrichta]|uniref:EF-hand domain-containing family member B n=1 Tax=Carlito syrichta TaxID=1868482 RepID=A0A3Q0DHG1_CARSF|nr:EF-hand domain-containing family member B [Carlito syrichta]